MSKELNTRIQNKIDTKERWDACNKMSLAGELYVEVSDDETIRIRIGDGQRLISNLPCVSIPSGAIVEPEKIKLPKPTLTNQADLHYAVTGGHGHLITEALPQEPSWNLNINGVQKLYSIEELEEYFIISGDVRESYPGTYNINFTPKEGYCWEDTTISTYKTHWILRKLRLQSIIEGVYATTGSFSYNETESTQEGYPTYSGTVEISAPNTYTEDWELQVVSVYDGVFDQLNIQVNSSDSDVLSIYGVGALSNALNVNIQTSNFGISEGWITLYTEGSDLIEEATIYIHVWFNFVNN